MFFHFMPTDNEFIHDGFQSIDLVTNLKSKYIAFKTINHPSQFLFVQANNFSTKCNQNLPRKTETRSPKNILQKMTQR